MTTRRRRIVRPVSAPSPARPLRLDRARRTLDQERVLVNRWMSRLKRALNALQKHQHRVAQLERRIRHLEAS